MYVWGIDFIRIKTQECRTNQRLLRGGRLFVHSYRNTNNRSFWLYELYVWFFHRNVDQENF